MATTFCTKSSRLRGSIARPSGYELDCCLSSDFQQSDNKHDGPFPFSRLTMAVKHNINRKNETAVFFFLKGDDHKKFDVYLFRFEASCAQLHRTFL